MAIVKIRFIKHAQNAVNYVLRDRSANDLVYAEGCTPEEAADQFKEIAKLQRGKGSIQALHIVQSWDEKESKSLPAETFQEMGRKLMEGKFSGHDYVIATHTGTGKTHNHIIVNPWHRETGKKVENKKHHLYQLRDLNDKICKEYGLSVINGAAKDRAARLPDKVQRMVRYSGNSFLLDMMQKADFARAYAVNYDQYVGLLGELNVMAVVQKENITYFYPGKTRGKRGSKLGKLYDKEGLDEAFSLNKEKFSKHPELRSLVRQNLDQLKSAPSGIEKLGKNLENTSDGHFKFGYRDLKVFEKGAVPSDRFVHPSEKELKNSFFPIEALHQARRTSIFDYCKKQNIALEKHSDSQWRLKEKPYVVMGEFEWTNTKNRTRGSLIEFVAAHKGISFLQAASQITENKDLLLLEKKFGVVKRPFTSFYIPKTETMEVSKAARRLGNMLRSFGASEKHADSLLSRNLAQVHHSGVIRLFSESDDRGALEFETNQFGRWVHKKEGKFNSPFITKEGSSSKAVIFMDPFTALKQKHTDLFSMEKRGPSILALMEPKTELVDQFLSKNPKIKHIEIIGSKDYKPPQQEMDFFHTLKTKHHAHDRSVEWASLEKGLSKGGPDLPGFDF